jgi:Fic-DOC domain mobile mystery protein B
MNGALHPGTPGATPVSPDEARFLKRSVLTRTELNLAERANIELAAAWLLSPRGKFPIKRVLDPLFVREVHRRMFKDVWKWAGKFRDCEVNIGLPPAQIQQRFYSLCADATSWVEYKTYEADETCVRFHHGLVLIHPWRNGNGRHSRLIADRLAITLGHEPFTWGGGSDLTANNNTRESYLCALRQADSGDFSGLVKFARS